MQTCSSDERCIWDFGGKHLTKWTTKRRANIKESENRENSAENMSYGISTTQFYESAKMNMGKKMITWIS
jgi:hypothetical protein